MDRQVEDFFQKRIHEEHNKDCLPVPEMYKRNDSEEAVNKFFKWIRHESKCKSLLLNRVEVPIEVKQEVEHFIPLAVSHRNMPGWRSITLYGYSSIMTNSEERYKELGIINSEHNVDWTDIAKFFPQTVEWIKKVNPLKEYSRVRLMIVDPGFSSNPHVDHPTGQMLCGPINIAVINPQGSEFGLENGGLVPWDEGDVRTMDLGSTHCVRNTGSQPRVHIIITPSQNDWDLNAKRIACRGYKRDHGSRTN